MTTPDLKTWILAIRPKTLTASISPVMIGCAMAFGDGIHHMPTAILCFVGALSIQIGTNLANDYYDFKKGADTEERLGPTRVTQAGLISPEQVKLSFIIAFAVSAIAALLLYNRGGMPVLILAVISILSGIFYTAGPRPLGYTGLGDIFVLIFFGPVAVSYTYFLQSFELNFAVFLAGFAPGLLSAAILTINNLRDMETDSKTGKQTLVVRYGKVFAYWEYIGCILLASLVPVIIYLIINDHKFILCTGIINILAIPTIITVLTHDDPKALNPILAQTGKLLMIYSVIFSIGWILW